MSLGTALLNKIIEEQNLDTWANLKKSYLPQELHKIHSIIETYVDNHHRLPKFEDLLFVVRDTQTQDAIKIIENEDVEAESFTLLEYLKNTFTEKEVIQELDRFIENSITHTTAEETIDYLYDMISKVESKVDIVKTRDSIERVELFDSPKDLELSLRLGLNSEYDEKYVFPRDSLIVIGGHRGSGKSIVCNNIAEQQRLQGKSVIKFTIEMQLRQELQRLCSISTGIPHMKIRYRDLSVSEWERVAIWWSDRYENGEELYEEVYLKDRDFSKFHKTLIQNPLKLPVIDIVHTPDLTVAKFKAETLKRLAKYGEDNVGLIIVDYMNKMRVNEHTDNKFDWKDQLLVSDMLKTFAEDIGKPILSPIQIKADGSVKFSQDILVPVDAAFNIIKGETFMEFENTKMRHMDEVGFISKANWFNLQIGPEPGVRLQEEEVQEI